LIKTLTGVYKPTSGRIFVRDKELDLSGYSVGTAHELSIETVYQDKSLGEKQPLWRNFFVGRQITNRFGFINVKKEKEIAAQILLNTIGFSRRRHLGRFERQAIVRRPSAKASPSAARCISIPTSIILDEPTVALAVKEVRRSAGLRPAASRRPANASIYIEHNLAHVHEVADRFDRARPRRIVAGDPPARHDGRRIDEFLIDLAAPALTRWHSPADLSR